MRITNTLVGMAMFCVIASVGLRTCAHFDLRKENARLEAAIAQKDSAYAQKCRVIRNTVESVVQFVSVGDGRTIPEFVPYVSESDILFSLRVVHDVASE